jgi:hypothetical protein
MVVSLVLIIFHPEDVVLAVEGYKHQALRFGPARELVRRFARHHGKSAGAKSARRHPLHFRLDASLNDDELLFGGVVVPRDKTVWRSFQNDGRRTFGEVAGFNRGEKALHVVVRVELEFGERPDRAVIFGLGLRKARDPEKEDREPKWRQVLQLRTSGVPSTGSGVVRPLPRFAGM